MNELTYPSYEDNADIEVQNENFRKIKAAIEDVEAHAENIKNPHDVTKAQVGLGNVDNTSDADKPVSDAQAIAIADAKKAGTDAQINLNSHIADKTKHITSSERTTWNSKANGSHSHTKSEVGLGNVDNTSDTNKPVSSAQATAIADAKKAGTDAQTNLNSHTGSKSNPHGVTAAQVGAAVTMTYTLSVSNTSWILNEGDNTYYQNITCQGLLESDYPILDVLMSTWDVDSNEKYAEAWSHILFAAAATNQLTIVTDGSLPSVSFQIKVKVVR